LVGFVQSVQQLIEQQQARTGGERASEQREPPLAVGEREKAPPGQRLYAQPPENRGDAPAILIGRGLERDVGTVDTRCHYLLDRVIPPVTGVLVLTLRPYVSDLALYLMRRTA
jgi:hypothetical protein